MPKKSILITTENRRAIEHITEFFQETESIPTIIRSKKDISALTCCQPDLMFFETDWVDKKTINWLNETKSKIKHFKCIGLGRKGQNKYEWDAILDYPIDERGMRRSVYSVASFPDPVTLMIVDDEPEVLELMESYFEVRRDVHFDIDKAQNGLEAEKIIKKRKPHCMIMDIKMPVKSGVELFRDLRKANQRIPTIVFLDTDATEDIQEMRKWGIPVFVEKSSTTSAMLEMFNIVKKLTLFS